MRLGIIAVHFDPCGYRRPVDNLAAFVNALSQNSRSINCFVHAKFTDERTVADLIPGVHVQAGPQNFLWQKERLVNLAIECLPPEYDAVAWIDGDLLFQNPDWYTTACDMLEHTPVLQLFETITYLGPDGKKESIAYGAVAAGDRMTFRAPGGAIACRRELLEHGLYDRNVMGGGDQVFLGAVRGTHYQFWKRCNPAWGDSVRAWCERFGTHEVGFVPGNVRHLWHGARKNRALQSRHAVLSELAYDPETDVRVGENGLLEWASDKPALHQAVRDHFTNRNEDGSESCQGE